MRARFLLFLRTGPQAGRSDQPEGAQTVVSSYTVFAGIDGKMRMRMELLKIYEEGLELANSISSISMDRNFQSLRL